MLYAFISYAHRDMDFVRRIVADLRNSGIPYWRDQDDLPPWEAWDDEIERMLRGQDITHFLYLHSASARTSDNVKNEIALAADNRDIKIIVLKLDDAPIPLRVYRRTYIDFGLDYAAGFDRMMGWLHRSGAVETVSTNEIIIPEVVLDPTVDQRLAAQDNQHQSVRIIAGPGTGKSFVIEERVRWLLEKGVLPRQIFVVSFTRSASTDLRRRIVRYCSAKGQPNADRVSVSTLHSLALRILRKSKALESFPTDPSVLGDWESATLFDEEFKYEYKESLVRDERGHVLAGRAEDIRRYHEALWSTGDTNPVGYDLPEIEVTDGEKESFERFRRDFSGVYSAVLPGELVAKCVEEYESGLIDPAKVLGAKHFIVDEMQDLNYADNRLIDAIAQSEPVPHLYVLGDDDQSVYAFRFAYPQGIQSLRDNERYPDVFDYTLRECFRCTPNILQIAASLIQANHPPQRLLKNLVPRHRDIPGVVQRWQFSSEQREAGFIAESCKKLVDAGISADDILILISSRKTQQEPLEKAFSAVGGIEADFPPTRGLYFSDAWMIFLYAIVRVVSDLNLIDYVSHRLLLGSLHNVGLPTCVGIKNKVITHNLDYLEIFYHPLPNGVFTSHQRTAIHRVVNVIDVIREWREEDTLVQHSDAIRDLIVSVFENSLLETQWNEFAAALPDETNLGELRSYLGARNRGQAVGVAREIYKRLGRDSADVELLTPRVQIMTMHGAKGLNAKIVFVPGLEDAIIPGPRRKRRRGLVHEAARLLYVAITRASAACVLSYATSRGPGNRREYNRRGSQFIRDLGGRFIAGPEIMSAPDVDEVVRTVRILDETSHNL